MIETKRKLALKKLMRPEYGALYDVSHRARLENMLERELRTRVKNSKRNLSCNTQDTLLQKLERYGNKGQYGYEKLVQLSQAIFNDKRPDAVDLGQWVSVEIECVMKNKAAENEFVAFVRKMGWIKLVTLKADGSIKVNHETHITEGESRCLDENGNCAFEAFGREIVISFKYNDWTVIRELCKKLNQLKTTVNKTCGLHVHFDCRHLTSSRQCTTLGKRIALAIPALKQILPKSRQDNRFCRTPINKHRDGNNGESRYAFVNLQAYGRHKTLEIRGHSGTTDATKIINWIKMLKVISEKRNTKKQVASIEEMIKYYEFEESLAAFVLARFKKFNPSLPVAGDDVTNDDSVIMNEVLTLPPQWEEEVVNIRQQMAQAQQSRMGANGEVLSNLGNAVGMSAAGSGRSYYVADAHVMNVNADQLVNANDYAGLLSDINDSIAPRQEGRSDIEALLDEAYENEYDEEIDYETETESDENSDEDVA